jgi:hypothetical protein
MASITINDLNPKRTNELEVLSEQQTRQVKGGDHPGMAPAGAYEAGVSGNCDNAMTSLDSFIECLMHL